MLAEPAWNNFAGLRHNPSWYLLISSDHLVWWSLMSTIHLDVTLRSTFYLCKLHVYTLNLQCPGDIVSNTNMACPKVEGNVLPMRYLASPAGFRKSQMPLMPRLCHDWHLRRDSRWRYSDRQSERVASASNSPMSCPLPIDTYRILFRCIRKYLEVLQEVDMT